MLFTVFSDLYPFGVSRFYSLLSRFYSFLYLNLCSSMSLDLCPFCVSRFISFLYLNLCSSMSLDLCPVFVSRFLSGRPEVTFHPLTSRDSCLSSLDSCLSFLSFRVSLHFSHASNNLCAFQRSAFNGGGDNGGETVQWGMGRRRGL